MEYLLGSRPLVEGESEADPHYDETHREVAGIVSGLHPDIFTEQLLALEKRVRSMDSEKRAAYVRAARNVMQEWKERLETTKKLVGKTPVEDEDKAVAVQSARDRVHNASTLYTLLERVRRV